MSDENLKMRVRDDAMTVCCDSCGHRIGNVSLNELESYVGYACPECGANMLTRNDYEVAVALAAFVNDDANSLASKFTRWMRDTEPGKRQIQLTDEETDEPIMKVSF